ncbi:hypothetical protein OsI_31445 [Oryza sativa Indica Group]|uniref:Uncharacterized protein n=1 Tax=Oryza sativa subsp. indica TaxID=39946 RepID=A2Z1G2_ORYSI|nr:hypothetical protein OsI_31445 [Oryza sativa Indica Group]
MEEAKRDAAWMRWRGGDARCGRGEERCGEERCTRGAGEAEMRERRGGERCGEGRGATRDARGASAAARCGRGEERSDAEEGLDANLTVGTKRGDVEAPESREL